MAGENGETLRELVTRLIESAKDYARAEIAVAKQTALEWVNRARTAIIAIVIAIVLLLAALTVLVAALGVALAHWIGMAGGLAVAALLAIGTAGLLGWFAATRLTGKNG